ncbi:hypothetical protein DMN91_000509 [Ooceraea biroi]|uniref:Uncharacterized protein n=1 Tax=Ooceraea biroi TaxID=2015173 RepID=A0A3L8E2G2_OOCBI|nr:hypothetical protein DMN91_000509 [Ooceraea biroi]
MVTNAAGYQAHIVSEAISGGFDRSSPGISYHFNVLTSIINLSGSDGSSVTDAIVTVLSSYTASPQYLAAQFDNSSFYGILHPYWGSPEKMLWGRPNEVGKGRLGTSLPSNFASITLSPSRAQCFVDEASTSFSTFLPRPVSTKFAWLK